MPHPNPYTSAPAQPLPSTERLGVLVLSAPLTPGSCPLLFPPPLPLHTMAVQVPLLLSLSPAWMRSATRGLSLTLLALV